MTVIVAAGGLFYLRPEFMSNNQGFTNMVVIAMIFTSYYD